MLGRCGSDASSEQVIDNNGLPFGAADGDALMLRQYEVATLLFGGFDGEG